MKRESLNPVMLKEKLTWPLKILKHNKFLKRDLEIIGSLFQLYHIIGRMRG